MSLIYVHSEMVEETRNFLDDLRDHDVSSLVYDASLHDELDVIKEDLFRIDRQLSELCELNPNFSGSYKAQHAEAVKAIEKSIKKLLPARFFITQ